MEELILTYICKSTSSMIPKEYFPDSDMSEPELKYSYVIMKDVVSIRSNSYCKNWLLQLKQNLQSNPSYKTVTLPSLCKWTGCLSSLLKDSELQKLSNSIRKMPQLKEKESAKSTRKARKASSTEPVKKERKLAPIRRGRSAEDTLTINSLCSFHNILRYALKSYPNTASFYSGEGTNQLWKAIQAGMHWQNELNEKTYLGMACIGKASEYIQSIISKYKERNNIKIQISSAESLNNREDLKKHPELFSVYKEKVIKEISESKKNVENEVCISNELRRIMFCEVPKNYLKHVANLLREVFENNMSDRLERVRSVRKQVESLSSIVLSSSTNEATIGSSSRPTSVSNQDRPVSDFRKSRVKREELNKKFITTSPYFDTQLRFKKTRQTRKGSKTAKRVRNERLIVSPSIDNITTSDEANRSSRSKLPQLSSPYLM